MAESLTWLAAIPILIGAAAGGWALRRAWRLRIEERLPWMLGGWAILIATLLWPAWVLGAARGPFIAVALIPAGVLAVVTSGATVKAARADGNGRNNDQSLAPEPLERPSTAWRTILRWLLAGPIGMIAAMAVGVCYAVWVPGEPQTRLLISGLMVPVLWGGAMAWTLADSRILRATAMLAGVTLICFTAAILRGFA
ncbi:hypothetical protein [Sphingomonas alpina]|uniref:Uncharacterized protein n=1 Tax=Sphingomonas alpina TaxID=653931 RepID=A0A7H0LFJ5_9SPHN|nr:hypothetical protein [Sphingomonas alpina]QNQ08448.1 hypothetical protein H3Z74_17085 [Sphingomonas alpina]